MLLRRNEILTGILVVATIVVLTAVLIMLGAPGLFRPLVTYRIYIDNAAGIKLGAPVLLAGRKIGQVDKLYSPISKDEAGKALEMSAAIRPPPDPNAAPALQPRYEARIDVRVDKSAMVYKDAHTRLITLGLLGEMAIDITQGSDAAGRAQDGQMFAGERVPEFGETIAKVIDMLQPVAKEASATLKELQATASNLGNTPAVARSAYVHPAVVDAYLDGGIRSALVEAAEEGERKHPDHTRELPAILRGFEEYDSFVRPGSE